MRDIFLYPVAFLILFNNYTWCDVQFAFNHYGGVLFPSNPFLGTIIIIILLMLFIFTEEIVLLWNFLKKKFERR